MPSVHDDGKRIVYSKCGSKIILTDNIDKIIQEIFEDIREGSVVLDARLKLLKLILCQRWSPDFNKLFFALVIFSSIN